VSRIEKNDKICFNCIDSVCCLQPLNTSYSAYVSLKEYKPGSLKYVSEDCFQLFLIMEIFFRRYRNLILSNKRDLFMDKLQLELMDYKFCKCSAIKTKIINRFIEFRCKNLGKLMTKNIKKKTSCLRASKSVAMKEMV